MKNLFSSALVLAFTAINGVCGAQSTTIVDANQFEKETVNIDSTQILDVRTAGEYNTGHIKNAIQADFNDKKEFERRISYIDKKKPIYVYCGSSGRSGAAAKEMEAKGYQNLHVLKEGLTGWRIANKPVEGKSTEKEMTIEKYGELIKTTNLVLVDFGAVWCAPCKTMEPVLKELKEKQPNKFTLVKVNGGNDIEVMKQNGVTVLPVFVLYKNGKQVWRKDGVATVKEMEAALQL